MPSGEIFFPRADGPIKTATAYGIRSGIRFPRDKGLSSSSSSSSSSSQPRRGCGVWRSAPRVSSGTESSLCYKSPGCRRRVNPYFAYYLSASRVRENQKERVRDARCADALRSAERRPFSFSLNEKVESRKRILELCLSQIVKHVSILYSINFSLNR